MRIGNLFSRLPQVLLPPVYDGSGKPIGQLFMKVDDRVNKEKYFNEHRFEISYFIQTVKLLSIIFLSISGIFLWFLLPTWVYIDAQERDVRTPGIWAFLALTSLFFGLTIYLITRPANLKTCNCPKCDGGIKRHKGLLSSLWIRSFKYILPAMPVPDKTGMAILSQLPFRNKKKRDFRQ